MKLKKAKQKHRLVSTLYSHKYDFSFYPVTDPVTPISLIDKISLFMGVHEQSAVVVMDLGTTIILNF